MSKQKDKVEKENVYDDGTYVAKKSKKYSVLMFFVCFLIAFVIWLYASNKERDEMIEKGSYDVTESTSSEVQADITAEAVRV